MAMGLPNINIVFKQEGITAIARGERGIVGLILKDSTQSTFTVYDVTDIPSSLNEDNIRHIKNALIGYTNAPLRVEVFALASSGLLTEALEYFEGVKFDYLCYPQGATQDQTDLTTWIKSLRDNEGVKAKVVVANVKADHEGVINFTQDGIVTEDKTCTASEFLPRIAGLICGTDLKISCTYAPFNEVIEIPYETKQATNSRIANGEFVMFKEFGKIKVARGITSLTTTNQVKGDLFQKIKVVDAMDLISNDLRTTIRENYIGKYANSYENKLVLIGAVRGYLDGLYLDGLIDKGYEAIIDVDSQKAYLKSIGVKVEELNEQQIKEYNTKDKVFLQINVKILDAIEDVAINVIM